MNILEYSVNGWEGTTFRATLIHPTNTVEKFKEDIKELLRERGKEYIGQGGTWIDNTDWCEFILPDLLKMGYTEASIGYVNFSEVSIIREEDQYSKEWMNIVGQELFNLALEKNKQIEEEMYNQL